VAYVSPRHLDATGDPLQPVAASAGGLLGWALLRLILRRPRPKADARTSASIDVQPDRLRTLVLLTLVDGSIATT
jgi:hypothetical protein